MAVLVVLALAAPALADLPAVRAEAYAAGGFCPRPKRSPAQTRPPKRRPLPLGLALALLMADEAENRPRGG